MSLEKNSFSRMKSTVDASVCSVAARNGYCVAGTRDSEIYGFQLDGNPYPQMLVLGHHDNNLNALACHPRENIFATGGDDCSLRFECEFYCFLSLKLPLFFSLGIDFGMLIECR